MRIEVLVIILCLYIALLALIESESKKRRGKDPYAKQKKPKKKSKLDKEAKRQRQKTQRFLVKKVAPKYKKTVEAYDKLVTQAHEQVLAKNTEFAKMDKGTQKKITGTLDKLTSAIQDECFLSNKLKKLASVDKIFAGKVSDKANAVLGELTAVKDALVGAGKQLLNDVMNMLIEWVKEIIILAIKTVIVTAINMILKFIPCKRRRRRRKRQFMDICVAIFKPIRIIFNQLAEKNNRDWGKVTNIQTKIGKVKEMIKTRAKQLLEARLNMKLGKMFSLIKLKSSNAASKETNKADKLVKDMIQFNKMVGGVDKGMAENVKNIDQSLPKMVKAMQMIEMEMKGLRLEIRNAKVKMPDLNNLIKEADKAQMEQSLKGDTK